MTSQFLHLEKSSAQAVQTLEKERNELQERLDSKEVEYQRYQQGTSEEISRLRNDLQSAVTDRTRSQQQMLDTQEKLEELKQKTDEDHRRATGQNVELQLECTRLRESFERQAEVLEKNTQLAATETKALRHKHETQIAASEKDFENLRQQYAQEAAGLRDHLAACQSESSRLTNALQRAEKEIEEQRRRLDTRQDAWQEERNRMEEERAQAQRGAKAKEDEQRKRIEELELDKENLNKKLTSSLSKIAALEVEMHKTSISMEELQSTTMEDRRSIRVQLKKKDEELQLSKREAVDEAKAQRKIIEVLTTRIRIYEAENLGSHM
eukprot:GHVT01011588.1.p1 GENE.GHVT01011588.1~~GHVT01011588.1.p1  ORF type:complete len:324 (+),score=61.48 GHVT01011588.1:921-1892(+)